MNERIEKLAEQAEQHAHEQNDKHGIRFKSEYDRKFAELIVRECMAIARNREDELESANLLRESRAVGIVVYRMARQFGVEE